MTQALLISSDTQTPAAVTAVLEELDGFSTPIVLVSVAQARLEFQRRDIDLVLVDESVEDGQGLAAVRELATLEPLIPICLLTTRMDADSVLRAVDAGVRAVLPLPPSVERYAERLRSLSAWTRAAHGYVEQERESLGRPVGRVVALIGAKGGVGTSMIALSAAKAAAGRGRTVLLDLDLRGGDLASYCGIRVRHSVVDLVSVAAELGGREVSEVAYPVRSGIELLPAPEHGEMGEEMTEAAARQIVQALRYQYDHVVIDCGSRLDEGTAGAMELADTIVVVTTPEVPALRAVRRFKETLERLELARSTPLQVVLNRTSRNNEIQPAGAAKLMDAPLLGTLPESAQRLEPALNTGTLLDLDLPVFTEIGQAVAELLNPVAVLAAEPVGAAAVPDSQTGAAGLPPAFAPGAAAPPAAPPPPSPSPAAPVPQGRRARRAAEENDHGRGMRLPSIGGRRRSAEPESGERGATAVEFAGAFIIALGVFFLCFELLLFGGVSLVAHNSAQEAARNYAVGMSHQQVMAAVSERMPGSLASGLSVSSSGSDVRVSIEIPGMIPGIGPAVATAHVERER
ncbi:AAA family ATPase [Actinomyces succiniciruminis]|uniref:TadE-like protein n=1 Tax=Actinomyces succiniciruminis TaxID=1522002 RepID=A0A1L7R997_9ACTO|nr:AAA family ATPase [Actinomyces succiniciruminis]CED90387.1 TadE-like protein [Actinomyces succiniciruminis]